MSSRREPEIKSNKMKKPEGSSKDARETSNLKGEELQRKAKPARQGAGVSQPQGACGTSADETQNRPSAQDVGLTKQSKDRRDNRRGKPRQVTKGKTQGPPNEEGKLSSDRGATLRPNKGGTQETRTPGKQPTDFPSKTGRASRGGNSNKNKQDPKGSEGGASREVHKGKVLPSSNGKGRPPGKNHRPGKGTPAIAKQQTKPPLSCGQHRDDQKKSRPRKRNVVDLSKLKEKDCIEVVRELNESLDSFKFFLRSEKQQYKSDEFILDLTCTLAIACDAPSDEKRNRILAALKGSSFFTSKTPYFLDHVQTTTALNNTESRRQYIGWLIKIFTTYLKQLPSSYADPPYDQLKKTLEQSNIDENDELTKQLRDFKQVRDDIIKAERAKHGRRYNSKAGQQPPNDFRDIPICPTNEELKSQERPFLRKNIKKGQYQDFDHYLDVQFRLLREDFLEPLREGIYEITHNVPRERRNQLMKCYQRVQIVGKEYTTSGINYKVHFDVSTFGKTNWGQSKRLIFGSFLCLSKDNFQTMLFATVANRDPKDLEKGKFSIRFLERQNTFEIEKRQQEYQLVESPAYFEAYRHVLKGLQGLDESSTPFTKYLVECSPEVDPPEYLRHDDDKGPVCYDLSKVLGVRNSKAKKVPVLEPEAWRSVGKLHLNRSQLEALQTAITTEFSIIQGPPGTGKTYVGAKIVRCLLDNREKWDELKISPMLMVCYTNHALDQFLEKILEFLPKEQIIRVGGRCKSEKLKDCNLKLFTKTHRRGFDRFLIHEKIEKNGKEIEASLAVLAKAKNKILELRHLEGLMNVQHTDQLYKAVFPPNVSVKSRTSANTFKLWLCNNKQLNHLNRSKKVSNESETNESQDGSTLSQDEVTEDVESRYDLPEPVLQANTTYKQSEDDLLSCNEQFDKDTSRKNRTKENITDKAEVMPTFPFDQGEPTKLKDSLIIQNGSSVRSESLALDDSSSNNQASHDNSHVSTPFQTKISVTATALESRDNQSQFSDFVTGNDGNTEEMTITIEDDATRLQDERCIEGDDECVLMITQQSHENEEEEGEEDIVEEQKESKKPTNEAKCEQKDRERSKGGKCMDDENSQKKPTADTHGKKIDLTANINKLKVRLKRSTVMSDDEAYRVTNIWDLSADDRLRLYLYWLEYYREYQILEIQRSEEKHEELCTELAEVSAQEEEEVIRRATVVGMTTSGAARYHSMLQKIAPKIVIIEEAAEVMEAHIVTSLSHNTQHTILIGDHKQLRPKATVYELAQKYNLEISLFERMVLNNMECKCLSIQHRMRPEIAALTKRIYEQEIIDHESVCKLDDISGLRHNLFFIDHCQPEISVGGLQSFSNPHEAGFLVALCRYLLLQGYEREQITILTTYAGQLFELKNKMSKPDFEGVKVCVVDNFQGEENDIILLSLVRSNLKIGFVKESNRICVALSRARQGFYCVGNFTLLRSQCSLWKEICDDLETKNAIGQTLQLVCKRHNNSREARNSCDFLNFPLGGCDQVCGERLDCGHACDRMCHPTDEYHEQGRCPKKCLASCPNEHKCQKRCHYPTECFCTRPVLKKIPRCGHQQTVKCYVEPEKFICQVSCEKSLYCGHKCNDLCGNPCTSRCEAICNKSLPCGHKKDMPCYQDPIIYSQCNSYCNKVLECGHLCSTKCGECCQCNATIEVELSCKHVIRILCSEKDQPPSCPEKCSRELHCGHKCPGHCHEDCSNYRCEILVEKVLPCDHKQTIPCHVDPLQTLCQKLCLKKCDRGHSCQKQCHFGLPCNVCKVPVCMIIPSCEHSIKMPCFFDPAALICKMPCKRLRLCGHLCRDFCGKNCEARPCMKLVPRTLPCKHTVTLACHKDPETYRCKEKVLLDLPCGHRRSMDCYALNAGLENVLCDEKMEKDFPCNHKVVLPCHSNPEKHKCKRKVDIEMACGHTKSVICSEVTTKTPQLSCMVLVTKILPCKHKVTMPCCTPTDEYVCQVKVEVILSCEHKEHIECIKVTKGFEDVKCYAVVTKELPCGHKKETQCFVRADEVVCDAPCDRVLTCKHPCKGRCGDECNNLKCATRVEKSLGCGFHKISCLCSDDVSQVLCLNKCERKLPCGHDCIAKCSETCNQYKCKEMVTKKLSCPKRHSRRMPCYRDPTMEVCVKTYETRLDCGHLFKGFCGQPCETMRCTRKVEMKFSCGHKKKLPCFHTKTAICRAPCLRPKGSCNHLCKGWCGEPCSKYPCKVPVVKTLRCGHNIKMRCCDIPENVPCPAVCGANLPCDHQCSGTCGDCCERGSHAICQNPCSHFLVCLHRCGDMCCLPCPPCAQLCTRKCPHKKCNHTCSEPCDPCRQPCMWRCRHYQCNNLCEEDCDRPPCDAPCPRKLPCGHPCIGLCGERCPHLCAVCNAKKLSSILADGFANETELTRCLQLFDCGHIIKVDEMDAWILREQTSDVQLIRCPRCSTPITFSYRYGNLIKRSLKNVENVKAQVKDLVYEVANSVKQSRRKLLLVNYQEENFKFPQAVLRVARPYSFNMRNFRKSDLPLLFTLKNHLTIVCQTQATAANSNITQQPEVKQLLKKITDELQNIKEYLEQPQLNLKTLSQVHEKTRKFLLFSHALEVQRKANMHQIPLSNMGTARLKKVHDQFALFPHGNDDSLDLEWLEKIVNLLRAEVNLSPLPAGEEEDFANFPGYQCGVWKMCREGHVYYTRLIVRGGKEVLIGGEGCTQCRATGQNV